MSAGWGKKAATRIDRTQYSNDELLKSLGSQFNVDFSDYDQWQRSGQKDTKRKSTSKNRSFDDGSTSFTVSRTKSPGTGSTKPPSIREKRQAVAQENKNRECSERVEALEVRLNARRKTCEDYDKRSKELLNENIHLYRMIEKDESTVHDGVKVLLRRYEKYRSGMETITSNFAKELETASEDLEVTKVRIKNHIDALETEVRQLNELLTEKQNELKVLVSYKDKEYPVKAMKIASLNTDIANLKLSNQEDRDELDHIVKTELGKYEDKQMQVVNQITRTVSEKALDMMDPSLKEMACQNMVMAKEIDLHKHEQEQLMKKSELLEQNIGELLQDKKSNTWYQMFPEFYPNKPKCTPDMDIVLDIPTQEWIPI